MTITVWIKREVVLNWEHFKDNLEEIYQITTKEPGDLEMVQVNMSFDLYKEILTSSPR
jgi:hypothetical protein